ncbi:erythropoietin receptor isoform X2 [Patagioenas fasciata]|uniref:erythropoietin receptor isoform X2 n=1 Tax=Patagioenas fasciata TaxID=372321 RepID=UPI003A99A9AA
MQGPGGLLALGGLLAWARGGAGGGTAAPPDFEVEAGVLLAEEPLDPKCFSRLLHDLTCFWDSDAPPDPWPFRLQYRLEQEPWQNCSLAAVPLPRNRSRFWCSLPPAAAVAFLPLELRVLPPPPRAPPAPPHPLHRASRAAGPPPERVGGAGGGAGAALRALGAPPQPLPGVQPGVRAGAARPGAAPPHDMDPVTLGLSCLLALLLLGLGLLALLGHRRALREKLWPAVPGPEREFEGLFSAYGGNFQLWLCQGVGAPWAPPAVADAEELPSAVEEVLGPPPSKGPPAEAPPPSAPPAGPSPSPSFEYTLFDPTSALLCPPPRRPPDSPYANLAPQKGPPPDADTPKWVPEDGALPGDGDPPGLGPPILSPPYVLCS